MRTTPFGLVFTAIAPERFPAIREALQRTDQSEAGADRDQFVLLEPVGRLLRDIVPPGSGPDELEAHALLLHHAYRHWVGGARVYRIGESALSRAAAEKDITARVPHGALYLQLPELRVWGSPTADAPPEPLDGVFVTEARGGAGGIAVLGIFGMRPDRPGFSAIGLEGRADTDDPSLGEIEVAAARKDGGAPFGPILAGGTAAGLYSLANHGELLLLVCRLLTVLPDEPEAEQRGKMDGLERFVPVE
jgi:hypothetical protein